MPKQREPVSFLVFSASLRVVSLNTLLARLAANAIEKHYPCAKTAWIEFLGEHPNSPVDRVDNPAQA